MRLVLFVFPLAIGLGYLLGGRLHRLGNVRFRHAWAGLAGVVLQLVPIGGTLGFVVLVASFALLLFVAWVNRRLPGFALVVAGLCLNFLVIAVNEGMPVTREAIVASDQAETLDDIRADGGTKHHLATPDDDLLFLADRFGVPAPIAQAVSVGDVVAYAGVVWFVVAAMRRRREEAPVGVPAAETSN
jgi:hypothetical protein